VSVLRALAVIIGMLVACTACSTATPTPAPASAQRTPDAGTRPRDIDLHGLDACALLTPEQRAGLGLDHPPHGSTSQSAVYGGQVSRCSVVGTTPTGTVATSTTLVTTAGVDRFDTSGRIRIVPTRATGFPALVMYPNGSTDYCGIAIDVASGQLIEIQFSDVGSTPPIDQDDLCQNGLRVAEAVTNQSWATAPSEKASRVGGRQVVDRGQTRVAAGEHDDLERVPTLRKRRLDPATVAARALARVLPKSVGRET
jgi:hypothetical protein